MENELYHHGVKGMHWGIRRYQNPDGSLTDLGRKKLLKSDGTLNRKGKRKLGKDYQYTDQYKKETAEERRARTLKSNDPNVIYANRDVLSTPEIRERMDRIRVEGELSKMAESTKKTGMDKVDSIIKAGKKLDELYQLTNTPLGKAVKKKLGIDETEKEFDIDSVYKNRNKLKSADLKDAVDRIRNERTIKKYLDDRDADEAAKRAAEKQAKEDAKRAKKEAKDAAYRDKVEKKAYEDLKKNPKTVVTDQEDRNFEEFKSVMYKDGGYSNPHSFTFDGDTKTSSKKAETVDAEVVDDDEMRRVKDRWAREEKYKDYVYDYYDNPVSSFTSNTKRISDGKTFALGFTNDDPRRWNK